MSTGLETFSKSLMKDTLMFVEHNLALWLYLSNSPSATDNLSQIQIDGGAQHLGRGGGRNSGADARGQRLGRGAWDGAGGTRSET